jgi:hypothetical protein
MKTFKFKLASFVDIITNSSSTIYTYCEASEGKVIEVLEEIIKLFGVKEKVKDMFFISVASTKDDYIGFIESCRQASAEGDESFFGGFSGYYGFAENEEELKKNLCAIDKTTVAKILDDFTHGKIEKPVWMKLAEDGNGYEGRLEMSTQLILIPKKKKYEALGEKLVAFLGSTKSEEHEYNY